nr:autotransporter-associated N-terminal domain-containing protein [uncultured Leptotrichia sp.]
MTNNLKRLEKDLKAFAKRCKDFKYTEQALLAFLLGGIFGFSETTDKEIQNQRQEISTSIGDMRQEFRKTKAENNKLMKDYNLELIQLMEQGDQVVKSPWKSWQYGANTFLNEWKGTYKGHGDKTGNVKYKRSAGLGKYNYQATEGKYGTTSIGLGNAMERPVEIQVDASLRTLSIDKPAPTFVPTTPSGGLPPFEPKIIMPPKPPVVETPDEVNVTPLSFPSTGANPSHYQYSYWNQNDGDISQVSLKSGTFIKDGTNISVKDYLATAAPGNGTVNLTSPTVGTGAIASSLPVGPNEYRLADGNYSNDSSFFLTLLDTPYSYFDRDVRIASMSDNSTVIDLEQEGLVNVTLNDLETAGFITNAEKIRLNGFRDLLANSTVPTLPTKNPSLYFNNKGTVELGGNGTIFLLSTTHYNGDERVNIIENSGKIIGMNATGDTKDQIVFYHSPDTSQQTSTVYINSGNIDLYGKNSTAVLYTSGNLENTDVAMINEGDINLYGQETLGVVINDEGSNLKEGSNFVLKTPVNQYGDKSIGVYIKNPVVNESVNKSKNIVRTIIGAGDNKHSYNFVDASGTSNIYNGSGNITGNDEGYVDEAKGIIIDVSGATTDTELYVPQISMEKFSRKGLGIYTMNGNLKVLQDSGVTNQITINGGEKNIGLYAKGGNINYIGNIIMGGSSLSVAGGNADGTGNIGIFGSNAKTITFNGNLTTYNPSGNTKDGVGVYASGGSVVHLNGVTDIKMDSVDPTKGATGIYATDAGSVINVTTGNNSKVEINGGTTKKGIGLFAKDGGIVNANGLEVSVVDGATAIATEGAGGSNINVQGSKITYSGEGYALYTNGGTIDASNANIYLGGKATGFERDVTGTSSITFTPTTTIHAMSDDVTIMNLKNATTLNLSTLQSDLSTMTGGVTVVAGANPAGGTFDKYKLAAVDGVNAYNIDTNLDKKIGADDTKATTNDYQFTRRLAAQRAKVNLKAGKKVDAILSTAEMNAIGSSSVVGLDMSSSTYAFNNTETAINLEAGSTVNADRTDAGNGAVGLFINYGKVNTDPSATINVEQLTANPHNDSAVGIYAVNGSDVDNQGTVNVGGNSSIGLLGLAYREDATTGAPKVNEFGGKLGEGTINIVNKGNVTLDGTTSYGIYVKNNNASGTKTDAKGTNTGSGVLTLSGDKSIGMIGDKATLTNDAGAKINMTGQEQVGMFANNSSSLINNGEINLAASTGSIPSVGIYTDDVATDITNNGKIIGGNKNYGIFGKTVTHGSAGEITVGDEGVGIYSTEGNITLNSGSKINVGANEAVGVFTTGTAGRTINADTNMTIGDSSFGYVIKNTGTTNLTTNGTATLGNEAKFIYSNNKDITVTNNVPLTSTGNNTYGIYSAGAVTNNADIDFGRGTGSVAIYAIDGGTARNAAGKTITVSGSNLSATPVPEYGMGMATSNGTIINDGTIKVALDEGIGMFASGSGSKAINNGTIELSGKNTKGMYVDNNAVGENWGIIKTVPTANNDGILGVVATGGGVIKNYGQIIVDGPNNKAGYLGSTGTFSNETSGGTTGTVTNTGGAEGVVRKSGSPTGKTVAGIEIIAPAGATSATIKINGSVVTPTYVDTNARTNTPSSVSVTSPSGATTIVDLGATGLGSIPTNEQVGSLGMYIDTSGVNYTHPIVGVNNLTGLQKVDLLFGNEAARYTDSKVIEVGSNIIDPYNSMILNMAASGTGTKFALSAGSLTWFATATQNLSTGALGKVYLVKIPYTAFAQDKNTYNFLDGLEQRYGVETSGREKDLFNKLNDLGKGEAHILAQAIDEMKGHQYGNVQQRINETGNVLDKEFNYLQNEWRNPTKDNNKIKVFGIRNEYNTDSAGIYDYTSNATGVAYVHENETVKLGNKSGWYAGAVNNHYKLKDISRSRENQTMLKAGIFKTMSPYMDHNGSLQWTIAGDVFAGKNEMKRRFWIVDDTFDAKSDYYSYGAAFKTDLGYDIRTSERTHLRPYGALKMEYGRFTDIKEDEGQVRLEVDGNNYFSVKPEVGLEFKYVQPVAVKSQLSVGLTAAYENELGKVNRTNKARVRYTNADWYELRSEKEDRRGNGKFDFNLGVDNTRFGVTVNAGYDTKGSNIRGGIGFRAIY